MQQLRFDGSVQHAPHWSIAARKGQFPRSCRSYSARPFSGRHGDSWVIELSPVALSGVLGSVVVEVLSSPEAAQAADVVTYNPGSNAELVKNAAGLGYILLVSVFLYRVLRRRAKRAREERVGGASPAPAPQPQVTAEAESAGVTPLNAFLGAAQAGLLALGLWVFTMKMQTIFDEQALPSAYTARNISVTVRTILLGLCYLASFVFAANTVGLTGLSLQLLFFPETVKDDKPNEVVEPKYSLPKLRATANPSDVRAAFEEVKRVASPQTTSQPGNATAVADAATSQELLNSTNTTTTSPPP